MFNVILCSVDYNVVKILSFSDFFDAVKFASRPEWIHAILKENDEKLAVYCRGELTQWNAKKFKF